MASGVSVIGLGHMGSALAGAFIKCGYRPTVWNRSTDRCKPFINQGALPAGSALDAVAATAVSVICITNYDDVRALLDVDDAADAFAGRTLVNLTSGAPAQAAEAQSWVEEKGAGYLDGAIPAYPRSIGLKETAVIFAGPREVWDRHRDLLLCLGGSSLLVGEDITAANVMTAALSSYYHVALLGFLEALSYAQTAAIDPQRIIELADARTRLLAESIHSSVELLRRGTFETDQSALSGHLEALQTFKDVIEEAGGRTALVSRAVEYLAAADAAGKGMMDIAAVLDVMRPIEAAK